MGLLGDSESYPEAPTPVPGMWRHSRNATVCEKDVTLEKGTLARVPSCLTVWFHS